MNGFEFVLRFYFSIDDLKGMGDDFIRGFFTQAEVWDIKQCDVCGYTVIAPYNCNLKYHVSKKHYVQGNFESILEKNKPITLKDAFENFNIDGFYYLSEKEFLELKNYLVGKNILTKVKK